MFSSFWVLRGKTCRVSKFLVAQSGTSKWVTNCKKLSIRPFIHKQNPSHSLWEFGCGQFPMNSTFWHLDEVICGFCHLSDVSRKSAGSGTVDRDLWSLMRKKEIIIFFSQEKRTQTITNELWIIRILTLYLSHFFLIQTLDTVKSCCYQFATT